MPSWLISALPVWLQWLAPLVLKLLVGYALPALQKAIPAEAVLIGDLIDWLKGMEASQPLKLSWASYHQARILD